MREFVDLRGASGTFYRFRLWPEGGAHPPIAGNYIVLREEANGLKVLLAGVTSDLSQAAAESRKALAKDPKSRFLHQQLNEVLDQKVQLLKTVALLPTRT